MDETRIEIVFNKDHLYVNFDGICYHEDLDDDEYKCLKEEHDLKKQEIKEYVIAKKMIEQGIW